MKFVPTKIGILQGPSWLCHLALPTRNLIIRPKLRLRLSRFPLRLFSIFWRIHQNLSFSKLKNNILMKKPSKKRVCQKKRAELIHDMLLFDFAQSYTIFSDCRNDTCCGLSLRFRLRRIFPFNFSQDCYAAPRFQPSGSKLYKINVIGLLYFGERNLSNF